MLARNFVVKFLNNNFPVRRLFSTKLVDRRVASIVNLRIIPNGYDETRNISKCRGGGGRGSSRKWVEFVQRPSTAHCWVGAMFHAGRRGFATGTISVAPRAIDVAEISFPRANSGDRHVLRPSLMSHCPSSIDHHRSVRHTLVRACVLILKQPDHRSWKRKRESCRGRFPVELEFFSSSCVARFDIQYKITRRCTQPII